MLYKHHLYEHNGICTGSAVVVYPYDNIKIFLKFLDEAAENKNVTSIKITLYRVNKNSKVIDSLIKAAENGKDVLAVVELRARFDEENNINYSEILENPCCFFGCGICCNVPVTGGDTHKAVTYCTAYAKSLKAGFFE